MEYRMEVIEKKVCWNNCSISLQHTITKSKKDIKILSEQVCVALTCEINTKNRYLPAEVILNQNLFVFRQVQTGSEVDVLPRVVLRSKCFN